MFIKYLPQLRMRKKKKMIDKVFKEVGVLFNRKEMIEATEMIIEYQADYRPNSDHVSYKILKSFKKVGK